MKRLWPLLASVWGVVIIGIAINLISTPIGQLLRNPRNLIITAGGLLLLGVVSWVFYRKWRQAEVSREWTLLVPAERLKPEDVGFQVVAPGSTASGSRRPYFADAYIPRIAVPYGERNLPEPTETYEEAALVDRLQQGGSFLLIGQPTEGKTRTLFEVARRVAGFTVVRPRRDRAPADAALEPLRNQPILLLIDDLSSFAGAPVDLFQLYQQLSATGSTCALAAACRDGHDLAELKLETTPLQRIYEAFPLKLALRRPDQSQKATLKRQLGNAEERDFPTLGAICMREAFELMRHRFETLRPEAQDCFRSLQLLGAGGAEPFTRRRVQGVLSQVFSRSADPAVLRDCVSQLAGNGLVLSTEESDPILPEAAFITGPEAASYYISGKRPGDDLGKLEQVMVSLEDSDGLHRLAITRYQQGHFREAIGHLSAIIREFGGRSGFGSDVAYAHFNRAVAQGRLKAAAEAIADYTVAIGLPDLPVEQKAAALVGRGNHKVELGDRTGAIADYTAVLDLPGAPASEIGEALINRGVTRNELADSIEAIADYTTVIGSRDMPPELTAKALVNRGVRRGIQGDADGELEDFSAVIVLPGAPADMVAAAVLNRARRCIAAGDRIGAISDYTALIDRPDGPADDVWEARFRRGVLHWESGDREAAVLDFTAAVEAPGGTPTGVIRALINRADLLGELGERQRAIADYTAAIERPEATVNQIATALVNRGVQRGHEGDRAGALEDFNTVIERAGAPAEAVAMGLLNRSVIKAELGDRAGAVEDNNAALALPDAPAHALETARSNLAELAETDRPEADGSAGSVART